MTVRQILSPIVGFFAGELNAVSSDNDERSRDFDQKRQQGVLDWYPTSGFHHYGGVIDENL
jgi:hypothetical protein